MISRVAMSRLPVVASVERGPAAPLPDPGRGRALGMNARGDAVLQDVVAGTVCRWDLAAAAPIGDPVAVPCAQDPLTPGLVAVDDSGARALVMACDAHHGDPALVLVDLAAKGARTLRRFSGDGWVVGGFFGAHVVCCHQHLGRGDDPRFTVLLDDKPVWSVGGMQTPCVPARVTAEVLALVVCPQPSALTFTGPSALCALDVASGSLAPLAAASGTRVTCADDAITVDGGVESARVRLQK